MGALIGLIPVILQVMNNPAVQQLMPLLAGLGRATFPEVDPNNAHAAGADLFDVNSIKWVQAALCAFGHQLDVDGKYGDATKLAVKVWQESKGLTADGWAGTDTQESLRQNLAKLNQPAPTTPPHQG